jgi:transcriptional regulator with XRE-family HTH domain
MSESEYEYVMTQLQLAKGRWRRIAEATGISKRTIEKIASGESKNPGVLTIETLGAYFRDAESTAA